jgi:hypothetical protein
MAGPLLKLSDAVELPAGVYGVVAERHYVTAATDWRVWTLESDSGARQLVAQVGTGTYLAQSEEAPAMPRESQVTVEEETLTLRHSGEARAASSAAGAHDFWLAPYRYYAGGGRVMLFTQDKDGVHRLVGQALDPQLVRVYR